MLKRAAKYKANILTSSKFKLSATIVHKYIKCTPPPLHEKDACIKYKFSYLFKLQTADSTIVSKDRFSYMLIIFIT